LLKIDDSLERSFYQQQTIQERWTVRELMRQKKSSLFLRLAAGKDKDAILKLASQGQLVIRPEVSALSSEQRRTAARTGAYSSHR